MYTTVTIVCCFRFLYEVLFVHGLSPVTVVFMASKQENKQKAWLDCWLAGWLPSRQTDWQNDCSFSYLRKPEFLNSLHLIIILPYFTAVFIVRVLTVLRYLKWDILLSFSFINPLFAPPIYIFCSHFVIIYCHPYVSTLIYVSCVLYDCFV
jgi:hypothetical protein